MLDLITGADLARKLGYSREYVRQLLERGLLPQPLGRLGNYLVWSEATFDKWALQEQPELRTSSAGVKFKTVPGRPGVVVCDEGNGRQSLAPTWPGAKLVELKPSPKHGALVRSEAGGVGRIVKNPKGNWTLAKSDPVT